MVLEMDMPIMDGQQFLEEFNKFPETMKERCKIFILSSTVSEDRIRLSLMEKAVVDFIPKPLTAGALKVAGSKLGLLKERW